MNKFIRATFANRPSWVRTGLNFWGPYLGTGIWVRHISSDWRRVEVEMKMRWFNRNYVGTHFGGSLFAMTDPFYMLMLMHQLGSDYKVWDQSASIHFKRPGKGMVKAVFEVNDALLEVIQKNTSSGGKYLHPFSVDICDETGEIVATVEKTLYFRLKSDLRQS